VRARRAASPAAARQAGWLAVKGPTGCRYLDDPAQRDYVINGWNITGDRYIVDEDGTSGSRPVPTT
jgi:2-aminobenzoate-CoA ligase